MLTERSVSIRSILVPLRRQASGRAVVCPVHVPDDLSGFIPEGCVGRGYAVRGRRGAGRWASRPGHVGAPSDRGGRAGWGGSRRGGRRWTRALLCSTPDSPGEKLVDHGCELLGASDLAGARPHPRGPPARAHRRKRPARAARHDGAPRRLAPCVAGQAPLDLIHHGRRHERDLLGLLRRRGGHDVELRSHVLGPRTGSRCRRPPPFPPWPAASRLVADRAGRPASDARGRGLGLRPFAGDDDILCIQEEAPSPTTTPCATRRILQLPADRHRRHYVKATVRVHPDGTWRCLPLPGHGRNHRHANPAGRVRFDDRPSWTAAPRLHLGPTTEAVGT